MNKIILAALALLFCSGAVSAQPLNVEKSNQFYRKAIDSYKKQNYIEFMKNMEQAELNRPNHPRLLYNLAAAYAINGWEIDALNILEKIVRMKISYPVEKDSDFNLIKNKPRFKKVVEEFARNSEPVQNGVLAAEFGETDFVPESVAYDNYSDKYFIGSVYKSKIVQINKGEVSVFAGPKKLDLLSIFGLKMYAPENELWVCAGGAKQSIFGNSLRQGVSKVYAFHIPTKTKVREFRIDDKDEHWFGDLEITPGGKVFISDSKANKIYFADKEKSILKEFHKPEGVYSLQGIASLNDSLLFIADYTTGLYSINIKTKHQTRIKHEATLVTLGIDGLNIFGNSLIAIQNGVNPNRVIQLNLSEDFRSIESWKILDSNHELFDEPTLGTVVGSNYYYIANSHWNRFDGNGHLKNPEKLSGPRVLKTKLK